MKNIVALPGDGIGPEVTAEAVKVLETVAARFGRKLRFQTEYFGGSAIDHGNNPLPDQTLTACRKADAILLGAIGGPKYDPLPPALKPETGLLRLRKELDLFANVRPVHYYNALSNCSPLKETVARGTDLIIVRELTGGLYYGERGRTADDKTATDVCRYTREEIRRVAVKAFLMAGSRQGKLTVVDKANVLETSRLWREEVKEVAKEFPDVKLEFLLVDHAAMKLITAPSTFDVILTENLFGDILSDEASVIPGSMGLMPSASLGSGPSLYEPIHGSWPEAAGQGKANPLGAILSAALMLEMSFGWEAEAETVRYAVRVMLEQGMGTADLGLSTVLSTAEVGDMVCSIVSEEVPQTV